MPRKALIIGIPCTLLLALFLLVHFEIFSFRRLPNIVFISIDTLRADHLGCYGYPRNTSPFIDTFAREGIQFSQAYTTMATTLPAHISMMTSTHTMTHGIKGNMDAFHTPLETSEDLLTFPQMLSRIGYRTAGFVSAAPLRSHSGFNSGFQVYEEPVPGRFNAEEVTTRTIKWLSNDKEFNENGSPVFMFVHYFDTHTPYKAPEKYKKMFRPDSKLHKFLKKKKVNLKQRHTIKKIAKYDAEIRFVDDQIKRLFEFLKDKELYEDSLIVLTADHGEGLGQHNYYEHGKIYNEQIHIPLIIKLPADMKEQKKISKLASIMDILPTVMTVLDLPVSVKDKEQLEGINLLNDKEKREYVFIERTHRKARWNRGLKYALLNSRWKYHYYAEEDDEFYNLRDDYIETKNLIKKKHGVADDFRKEIEEEIAKHKKKKRRLRKEVVVDPDVVQQLEALGYTTESEKDEDNN